MEHKFKWIEIAKKELGQHEYKPGDNPRIIEYLRSAGITGDNDEVPWCASFVHWCFKKTGIIGAGAWGLSWKKWGIRLNNPIYGSVAIFKTGHIGFFIKKNKNFYVILHGNWSNRVDLSTYIKPSEIDEFRFPDLEQLKQFE